MKRIAVLIVSVSFVLSFIGTSSAATETSFSVSEKIDTLENVGVAKKRFFAKVSETNKCRSSLQVGTFAGEKWQGWKQIACANDFFLDSNNYDLVADPSSGRVYLFANRIVRTKKGKTWTFITSYWSKNGKRWFSKNLRAHRIQRAFSPGAIRGAFSSGKMIVAYQLVSSISAQRKTNLPFYVGVFSKRGKALSKNLTTRPGKRKKIDGKFSFKNSDKNSFYFIPQNQNINFFWTLNDVTGREHSFTASLNLKKKKIKFRGSSSHPMLGFKRTISAGSISLYSNRLFQGDNNRFYISQSSLNDLSFSGDPYALYSIYELGANKKWRPKALKKIEPISNNVSFGTKSLLSAGFGVSKSGEEFMAYPDIQNKAEDCVASTENRNSFNCWRTVIPDYDHEVLVLEKFSASGSSEMVKRMAIPHFGSLKDSSVLTQWIVEQLGVGAISARSGRVKLFSAFGQEGISATGSIVPKVETRVYQVLLDL